jgi:hypothetical protein
VRLSVFAVKLALLGAGMIVLGAGFQAPAPTWPADGNIPASEKGQYVFLSSDRSSVIVAVPPAEDPNGPRKIQILSLHNRIDAQVAVDIKRAEGRFEYRYSLAIGPQSLDNVNDFSVVVSADPTLKVTKSSWGGMIAGVDIAKRVGLHYAPLGRFIGWLSPDAEPLRPGKKADFFAVTSANRPGFTTAYVGQFPAIESTGEMPEKVLDQLEPIADLAWVEKHIITFGPRYAESDTAEKTAQDYLAGIADLIRARRVTPGSPFIEEISSQLRGLAAGSSSTLTLRTAPSSPIETELQQAAMLCFGPR